MVHLKIKIPVNLTEEQKEILLEYAATERDTPGTVNGVDQGATTANFRRKKEEKLRADIEEELWKHKLKQKKSKCTKTQTPGIYKMQGRQVIRTGGDTCEVLQHSSLLEHHGNVTAVVLSGANVLISCSRDRSFNIHHFNHVAKTKNYERKSYL